MSIRVALVDDVDDVRRLIRIALRVRGGFEVVGEAADGHSAIDLVVASQPDIVVLDLGLPDLAGSDVVTRLREQAASTRIVVFTGTELNSDELLRRVDGLVRKDEDVEFLVDLLDTLAGARLQDAVIELPADRSSPAAARRFVEEQLGSWELESALDAALLVVSELVTNAVVHAETAAVLRVGRTPSSVRVEVSDAGSGSPTPLVATDDGEGGRGLFLVSALSAAWGVESTEGSGKRIWAEVPIDADR